MTALEAIAHLARVNGLAPDVSDLLAELATERTLTARLASQLRAAQARLQAGAVHDVRCMTCTNSVQVSFAVEEAKLVEAVRALGFAEAESGWKCRGCSDG